MGEKYEFKSERGFCGIGVYGAKFASNVGVLWRSAVNLGADYTFTIGGRYQKTRTDTIKGYKHTPLFEYEDFSHFVVPKGASFVCVEIDDRAESLLNFVHPESAVYLLGAEDTGLPKEILDKADHIIQIPSKFCMNVSMVGTIVLYDRLTKGNKNVNENNCTTENSRSGRGWMASFARTLAAEDYPPYEGF